MLFCLALVALLLYDSVFANAACSQTFDTAPGKIDAISSNQRTGQKRCEYLIHAPPDSAILLNFTDVFGFATTTTTAPPPVAECLPELEIVEVNVSSSSAGGGAAGDLVMGKICHNHRAPQVYESRSHDLKLTFKWIPARQSGFSVEFTFHHKEASTSGSPSGSAAGGERCEFTCADASCLPTWSMVCDGVRHCADRSDEHDCPPPPPAAGQQQSKSQRQQEVSGVQIIVVVVISVALTLGVVTCVVSHYKMGARSWNERRATQRTMQQPQPREPHYHHPTASSTVLYVLANEGERVAHEVALLRERHIRLHSVQTDMELELPPSIQLPDGEEFPFDGLQRLQLRSAEQESELVRECIRAPPNRTVFDGESPPPYHRATGSDASSSGRSTPLRLSRLVSRTASMFSVTSSSEQELDHQVAADRRP